MSVGLQIKLHQDAKTAHHSCLDCDREILCNSFQISEDLAIARHTLYTSLDNRMHLRMTYPNPHCPQASRGETKICDLPSMEPETLQGGHVGHVGRET